MIEILKNYSVYLLIVLVLLSFSVIEFFSKKRKITIISLVAFFLFYTLIGAFRSNFVGLDTLGYSTTYYMPKEGYNLFSYAYSQKPECGFYGLVFLFNDILHAPEFIFRIFTYLIISLFLFLTFYKEKRCFLKLSLFMFLGFFIMSYSGIRQAISISILTYAITLLVKDFKKKNVLIYFAFVILATLFHKSSVVFCILPAIFLIKVNKFNFIFVLLTVVFIPSIISSLIIFLSQYTYIHYQNVNKTISITMILTIILLFVYFIIHSIPPVKKLVNKLPFYKTNDVDGRYFSNVFWVVFIFIVFTSCNVFSTVVPRFAMYCFIGIVFFIDLFMEELNKKNIMFLAQIFLLLFFGFYFLYSLRSLQLVPYGVL